ncbi:MAG: hypothetical protein B6245_22465 [Desulfobacteraceae bacterium 4572_88]|nr:MAG: hypothetical protein B6245_22465 [Desulfobacteraceae bacterium 4572_88]
MKSSSQWITENFEYIVSQYGGKYVGVINDMVISSALTPSEVLENAKKLGKNEEEISLLKVPTQDEILCVL